MSSHTNVDEAAGAPLWAVEAIRKAKTSANRTDLFNDSTADNFISGVTIGLFNCPTISLFKTITLTS